MSVKARSETYTCCYWQTMYVCVWMSSGRNKHTYTHAMCKVDFVLGKEMQVSLHL